ncbi:amidohydrolase family protein [bacterium]|nr:amidohydrolase family protein [bacterium]
MPQPIIDAHVHLDVATYGDVDRAFAALCQEREQTNISHCVVLALEQLGLDNRDLAHLAEGHDWIIPFMSLNPLEPDVVDQLKNLLGSYPYRGLKLHPRFQKFGLSDERVVGLVRSAAEHGLPVLIDSFPYYPDYYPEISPAAFHELARHAPEATIIIAHACAHRVIEAMFVAKANPNVYLDMSFSLLYFRGSSVIDDLVYVLRGLQGNKVLYGSDYPDRGLARSLELTLEVLEPYHLDKVIIDKFLHDNAASLYTIRA